MAILDDYRQATADLDEARRVYDDMVAAASLRRARALLRLHVQQQMTVRAIAAEVGLHPSRVGAMLDQARRGLYVAWMEAYYGRSHIVCWVDRLVDTAPESSILVNPQQRYGPWLGQRVSLRRPIYGYADRHGWRATAEAILACHRDAAYPDGAGEQLRTALELITREMADEYTLVSVPAGEVSARATCVRCGQVLWVWSQTMGSASVPAR